MAMFLVQTAAQPLRAEKRKVQRCRYTERRESITCNVNVRTAMPFRDAEKHHMPCFATRRPSSTTGTNEPSEGPVSCAEDR